MFCIDASIIISAANPKEPYFQKSKNLLTQIFERDLKVFLPEIIIPEITSGLLRATGNSKLAYELALAFRNVLNFSFVTLDSKLANLASWVICKTGLKSADAVYVALAFDYNLELITLDKEQLEKGKKLIKVRSL
ncbi:MAG: type II toxin-antitoxin system VapC family toxin [Patescibacteria group bacterium]|nr:type II toxin-antitoxin system VapC family toxin [Patescibacteria group bacterium]